MTPSSAAPTPALTAWRTRGRVDLPDALWAAACWETTGLEAHRAGSFDRAKDCFGRADEAVAQDGTAVLAVLAVEGRQPMQRPAGSKGLAGGWSRL